MFFCRLVRVRDTSGLVDAVTFFVDGEYFNVVARLAIDFLPIEQRAIYILNFAEVGSAYRFKCVFLRHCKFLGLVEATILAQHSATLSTNLMLGSLSITC